MEFDIRITYLAAIDAAQAQAALSELFSPDLAYGKRVMDADSAQRYANERIAECAGTAAKIFTNAHRENDGFAGWNPVTKTTFDDSMCSS